MQNNIIDVASTIAHRSPQMLRLTVNVVRELEVDQAEAVAPIAKDTQAPGRSPTHISEPTYSAIHVLAPFAKWERDLYAALRAIDKAIDEAEITFQRVLVESGRRNRGEHVDAEPRCAGYSIERRSRLGGCGNVIETYPDGKGNKRPRPDHLCVSCRKEKNADQRAA